jgi:hypothetical protein
VTDPTSLPSFPPPEDEHPLRGRVLDALLDEGYEPLIDEDGDVAVREQDQMMFVPLPRHRAADDAVFGQWLLDDTIEGDELTRLRAANAVTGALNLVKATVHGDRLAIAVDLVVSGRRRPAARCSRRRWTPSSGPCAPGTPRCSSSSTSGTGAPRASTEPRPQPSRAAAAARFGTPNLAVDPPAGASTPSAG